MLRRILLPALLVIALFAIVGIASATVVRSADDSETGTTMADVTSTTIDESVGDDSVTGTTMADVTSTTIDESVGDDSVTSTTVPSTTSTTIDDGADSDDDFDDDDSTTSTTIDGAVSVPDGVHVINASPAGSVTVAVKDGVLSIVSIDIAGSWARTETEVSAREIELEFENDGTELKVKAEIEDGRVKVRAEFKTDDDSSHDGSDDDSGHGSDDD